MNAVRILHTADIHWHPDRQTEALASLQTLYEHAAASPPDLIVMAGDLFDRGVQNTAAAGFPTLVNAIRRLLDIAPIVSVYGTITHDIPGCYEIFRDINAEYSFTILDPARAYYLIDGDVYSYIDIVPDDASFLIFGCPEPQKDHFLANKTGLGRAEATEAINTGMTQIFAGIGARRAELPEVPALMVYHGTVRGATMCNGQTVPGTDIAVGRDDLALTGADYTALGHIHQAQEIDDGVCYAGSAYPVDWGEVDQKSFWDVSIVPGEPDWPTYHRVNFPHPPRMKITMTPETDAGIPENVRGCQVWINCKNTQKGFDLWGGTPEEDLAHYTKEFGILPGSRVTYEVIPIETVRAGEIQEAKTLREKVAIYAENSGDEYWDSLLDKADELERDAAESGVVSTGLRYRVKSLRLRGAIGILKGTGLEEIMLDLDDYDSGVIALAGVNGAGKSTLIENLHPYGCMLTRGGSLQSHFARKDSYRDLAFVDETTSDEYRALIQIDPTLATPKAEYHLYKNGTPITNGRKEDYDTAINRICGSLSLYVRSAFTAQKASKATPDLADATRGEKKELFRELGGLDYLQAYADAAKERNKTAEVAARVDEGKAEILQVQVAEIPAIEEERRDKELAAGKHAIVSDDLAELGKSLRIEVDTLTERVKAQDAKRAEIDGLVRRDGDLACAVEAAEAQIETARKAAENGPGAAEIVQTHADLTTRRGELIDERTEYFKGEAVLDGAFRVQMEAFQLESGALQKDALELERRLGSLRSDKTKTVALVDLFTRDTAAPIDQTCPTCHQALPEVEQDRLQEKRAAELGELTKFQEQALECDHSINELTRQQDTARAKLSALAKPERDESPPWASMEALECVEADLDNLNVGWAREIVTQAQEAAVRIEEGGHRIHDLNNQIQEIKGRMVLLRVEIDDELDHLHETLSEELEDLRGRYTEAEKRGVELQVEIRGLDERIGRLQELQRELVQRQTRILAKSGEAKEWAYLQRACGPDGIQALELDAMGPSITEVANRLLSAAYGTRFRLEIRTTRMAGKGSKTKQVEDFEIVVHDTDAGSEQALDTLSGGETVWIRKALYDAFGIIRTRSTGQQFLTAFLDEADGALDAGARGRYFEMIQAAHTESGRHHTIVITHSEEAQQAIAQRIEMGELR